MLQYSYHWQSVDFVMSDAQVLELNSLRLRHRLC